MSSSKPPSTTCSHLFPLVPGNTSAQVDDDLFPPVPTGYYVPRGGNKSQTVPAAREVEGRAR